MATATSTAQTNETVMRRFYDEILNKGNLAVADGLVASSFVEHIPLPFPGQPTTGPQAIKWFVTRFRTVFPDLHATIEDLLAVGDKVAVRVTWTGTHKGRFLDIHPTGKRVKVTGFDMVRIEGGKLVEHWGQVDMLSMMGQLGFLPAPDEAMG
jgi:predicted ester cyclase